MTPLRNEWQEIEIPAQGIEATKVQCAEALSQIEKETKWRTILRLYRLDMFTYIETALAGIVILLVIGCLFPSIRTISVTVFFLLLGCMAAYELYKHTLYDIEELLVCVYLNPGRSFLYKCILCSIIQFMCFLIVVIFHVFLFDIAFSTMILCSILPVYLIQCLSILFERVITTRYNVLMLYAISYAIYAIILERFKDLLVTHHIAIISILVFVTILLILLLWRTYKKSESEEILSWN